MSGRLTTHVLDTARGRPAAGVGVDLYRDGELVGRARTNDDGRTDAPLAAGEAFVPGDLRAGVRRGRLLRAGAALPGPGCRCGWVIADASAHYHVPLLASPWAYSTYRGS